MGRSLLREPSRLEGACRGARERKSTSKRPLTRETSAPWSSSCSGQTGMREEITADRPRAGDDEAKAPAEPAYEAGCRSSDGRACGSSRWQKSTNDAWPRTHRSDELSETRLGLAPSPSRGEGAKERWKPGPGWQNLGSVAGPRSRFGAQASGRAGIRRWKTSGSGRIGVLDGASRVAAPVGGCAPRRPLVLVRTSEEDDSLGTRKKTPRARGRSPRGPRSGPHQDRAAPAKQAPQAA